MNKRIIASFVAGALGAWATGAAASGFQLMEQNASGLGNAYAGQAAAAENSSTIFFNPAGMTRLPGIQGSLSVSAIRPSAEFSDSGASRGPTGLPEPAGGLNGGNAGGWSYLPTGYLSIQLYPSIWAGVGLSSPFGLRTEYDSNFIGRFQSQKTEITTYDINPSVAWKINDVFSVGAGFSYQHANLKIDRSVFVGVETGSSTDISDNKFGWNIGAIVSPSAKTQIGLSYRSGISHSLNGTTSVVGLFATQSQLGVRLPDTASIALAQTINDQWQLLADFTYTRWSTIKTATLVLTNGVPVVPFNLQFDDTWRVGVGTNYKWNQDFTLKLGVAYDKSPVSDQFRTTFLPDNDRIWLAIGGKYGINKQATVDFGYAHLWVRDGSINQLMGVGAAPFQGNVVGNYDNHVDILSAQINYAF